MALHTLGSRRFLLTNDDGVHAPGLAALRTLASRFGDHVTVAPHIERSGFSHLTVTHRDLCVEKHDENVYSIDGAPADCTRVGLHSLDSVDWVLSGVNNGGNLGVDIFYSGTIAAAREAVINGVPAIALSHFHREPLTAAHWEQAIDWLAPVLEDLFRRGLEAGHLYNVNLPNPDGLAERPTVVECPVDPSPVPPKYLHNGNPEQLRWASPYRERPRRPKHDVDVCFTGSISVTKLPVFPAA